MCAVAHIRRPRDKSVESVLCFYFYLGSRAGTQVERLVPQETLAAEMSLTSYTYLLKNKNKKVALISTTLKIVNRGPERQLC